MGTVTALQLEQDDWISVNCVLYLNIAIVFSDNMKHLTEEEEFTIISEEEVHGAEEALEKDRQTEQIERTIEQITEDEKLDLSERDISDVVSELRRLEEKLHLWREVRQTTIIQLREIADYIDSVARNTGIAKIVGSGGSPGWRTHPHWRSYDCPHCWGCSAYTRRWCRPRPRKWPDWSLCCPL